MKLLELTLKTPAENLALDEALLNEAVRAGQGRDVLRLWEQDETAVIIGRASRVEEEVHRDFCETHQIPVLRRCSGGAAVVIGPGCLMYSIVLNTAGHDHLGSVDQAHRLVLGRMREALRDIDLPIEVSGTSDLTLHDKKFSGNSLRCKRGAILHHGTLLYDGSIEQISRCLRMPPRQPDYRDQRLHSDFLVNLPTSADAIRETLQRSWNCEGTVQNWPREETEQLAQRYRSDEWNLQR